MKSKHTTFFKELVLGVSIFFLSGLISPLLAKRDATGDLTYIHISGNTYRFDCTYYRDCLGIPAPNFIIMNISSTTSGFNQNDTLMPLPGGGIVITNNCPGWLSNCDGGSQPGIEKYKYQSYITIPGRCPDWIFSISDCCRSSAITTIQNANWYYAYAEARLNNLVYDNSSPQFTNDPLFFIINQNQDFHYNNGLIDPDGDSLVYSLTPARSGPNTNVVYQPGYNYMNPVSSIPATTFDAQTGDLFIHPVLNEVGVIAYLIEDFRNGVMVGSVMRDVALFIFPTADKNPVLSGMDGTTQFVTAVLPGTTLCFTIFSYDQDATDELALTWNNAIPSASFTTTTGLHPKGTFCWTPTLNDVRPQPYTFTATVKDDYCPLNNAGVYSFLIYVTLDSVMVNTPADFSGKPYIIFLFPNPSNGKFTVQSEEKINAIRIFNSLGECIVRRKHETDIDISSQSAGIYCLEAETTGGKVMRQMFEKY